MDAAVGRYLRFFSLSSQCFGLGGEQGGTRHDEPREGQKGREGSGVFWIDFWLFLSCFQEGQGENEEESKKAEREV